MCIRDSIYIYEGEYTHTRSMKLPPIFNGASFSFAFIFFTHSSSMQHITYHHLSTYHIHMIKVHTLLLDNTLQTSLLLISLCAGEKEFPTSYVLRVVEAVSYTHLTLPT